MDKRHNSAALNPNFSPRDDGEESDVPKNKEDGSRAPSPEKIREFNKGLDPEVRNDLFIQTQKIIEEQRKYLESERVERFAGRRRGYKILILITWIFTCGLILAGFLFVPLELTEPKHIWLAVSSGAAALIVVVMNFLTTRQTHKKLAALDKEFYRLSFSRLASDAWHKAAEDILIVEEDSRNKLFMATEPTEDRKY